MKREVQKRLVDASTACERIAEFVSGKQFSEYEASHLLRSAVERQFEIIGEALNKAAAIEPTLTTDVPELRRIVGPRNRLIHGYDNVDDEILWDVVQRKLVPLKGPLDGMLDRASQNPSG